MLHVPAYILGVEVFEASESLAVEQDENRDHLGFRELAWFVTVLFTDTKLMFL